MDADEKIKMSSVLEACDSDGTISSSDVNIAGKESCNSFKTTDEIDSAESGSNRSSATSLEQSNDAFGKTKHVREKNETFDMKPTTTDLKEIRSEERLSRTPSVDVLSDENDSDMSLVVESEPDETGRETTVAVQDDGDCVESGRLKVDSAASGESKIPQFKTQLNISVEPGKNVVVVDYGPVPLLNVGRVVGDTFGQGQGHVTEVKPRHESVEKLTRRDETGVVSTPVLAAPPISSVVTILKPKAQGVVDDDVVAVVRIKSETLNVDASAKTPSFFIANFVPGCIDFGENAELIDDLIYWRNPKKTALIFVGVLSMLLAMQFYSLISVMAYLSLAVLACGFVGRLYSTSHGTENPILQFSPALSEENVRKFTDMTLYYVNDIILAMRRLYMVDDLGDSLKFALVLWYLTYVGLWFNGMTIVTISFVTIFTLPNVYEHNKVSIDKKMAVCWEQWLTLTDMARSVSQESVKRILSKDRHEKVQ